jgi:hypothetical protein
MQLWAGDKRLVNIQGKWSDELEEFIRMANLGVVAHRAEIKARVEAMLEYDPKDVAFTPTVQPLTDVKPPHLPVLGLMSTEESVQEQ